MLVTENSMATIFCLRHHYISFVVRCSITATKHPGPKEPRTIIATKHPGPKEPRQNEVEMS